MKRNLTTFKAKLSLKKMLFALACLLTLPQLAAAASYTDEEYTAMQEVLANNSGYNVVFYYNTNSWTTPYIHHWGNDCTTTDPGVAMTQLNSTNIWYYTTSGTPTGLCFNNTGNWSDQTGDLTWYSGGYYEYTSYKGTDCYMATITEDGNESSTSYYTDDEEAAMQAVLSSSTYTVFFRNSSSWTTINCYCWINGTDPTYSDANGDAAVGDDNNSWPGYAMTQLSGNIYYYTVNFEPEKVIFNNKVGDDGTQTSDFDWVTGGYYETSGYVATITAASSGDKVATAVEKTTVAEEAAPAVYYNLLGQRVSEDYKGIVIVNGKKFLRK